MIEDIQFSSVVSEIRSGLAAFLALALSQTVALARQDPGTIAGPPTSATPAKRSDAPSGLVAGVASLKLAGHVDWTNSGVEVRKGDRVRIRAWGRVRIAAGGGRLADPAGIELPRAARLLSSAPACQLIAVVGDNNNDYIAVGKDADFRAPHDGTVFLTLNQVDPSGNSGDFDVRLTVGNGTSLDFGRPAVPGVVPGIGAAPVAAADDVGSNERTVVVQPKLDWTNSYITVNRGDRVVVTATGTMVLDLAGHSCGPNGGELKDPGRLIPGKPTGALVAVVGIDNNDFIYLGASGSFVSQRTGLLFLGVNEEDLTNNSGSFLAHVTIERKANQ